MYKSIKAKFSLASEETDAESSEKSSGGHSQVLQPYLEGQEDNNWNREGRFITDRGKNVSPWGQPSNEADCPVKFCRLYPSKFQGESSKQHGP